ncbi:M15 family metallopeptidase [Microterricola pindariensis]|uniref:M15 family metallopeptidase n=1 Tax=Microterricola pindariensis TaxID=478010 RepID=UPI001E5E4569|nr:M15 family metallopeptidase [Microterricola pindariensis]
MSELQRPRRRLSRQVRLRRTIAAAVLAGVIAGAIAIGAAAGADRDAQASNEPSGTPTATPDPTPSEPARPSPDVTAPPVLVPSFDKSARSIDDPNSIWLVVNKLRPLNPADYAPADLVTVPVAHTWDPLMRQEASDAIVTMFAAATSEAGLSLASNSAYRSYTTQVELYAGDDNLTARPGYSEHQTGLTMDIGATSGVCSLATCFTDTAEGVWLRDNAWRFGYLLRYPADKTAVTGYDFEPWHFRYIGVELSTEMHNTGFTTLEEFFGLPAAPAYP